MSPYGATGQTPYPKDGSPPTLKAVEVKSYRRMM